jgi:hypothetical protein
MKFIWITVIYLSLMVKAVGQVSLSPCQGNDRTRWFDCIATHIEPDGNKYTGAWRDGRPNGQGIYIFASGTKYMGEFEDGKFNGRGRLTFTSGANYDGQFKNGKFDGKGTRTFGNGDKYSGDHKEGESNGRGVRIFASGAPPMEGIWKNGDFVRGEKITPDVPVNIAIDQTKQLFQTQQYAAEQTARQQQRITQETRLKEEQRFAQEATEINRLRVEAEESKRKQSELEEQLRLAKQQNQIMPLPAMTTMANRRALVIGNDTYKSVTELKNAREDAKAMASSLSAVGYKVTLQLDLNEKEMKAALRTFSSQIQGGDEVMFFFAGHGVQLGAANYLLPTDIGGESEAQVKDEAIQLQRILDDMTDKKAKFTLAMIDACRDNPFKTPGRNIGGRGLAPTTAATGQMVVFSAGTGQQALDRLGDKDKNKNGVFTRTFLKEMQKPGISIDRIVKNVRNEVAELAKSIGHEQVPAIYDQVLGDFYFKK